MKKSQSPLPPKAGNKLEKEMPFLEALGHLIGGMKITRKEWADLEEYCLLKDNFLMIHRKEKFHTWIVSEGDILAIDWVVIK